MTGFVGLVLCVSGCLKSVEIAQGSLCFLQICLSCDLVAVQFLKIQSLQD